MRKYWFVFSLYWQEGLSQRASFFIERFRSLIVLISFYYFWSALLARQDQFAGYNRAAMITYVLGMNVLRSLVFASRTWEIAYEINHGRLSAYLLKPVNFMLYTLFRDLAEKSTNLLSAIVEVFGLILLFGASLRWPHHPATWIYFLIASAGAMLLYYLLTFAVGCWGFWTAESGGPRFLLELVLEFSAGAFFPLDVLPASLQAALRLLPSPYLMFFPLQVFLERLSPGEILQGFAAMTFWLVTIGGAARFTFARGIRTYGAEGA